MTIDIDRFIDTSLSKGHPLEANLRYDFIEVSNNYCY